MNDPLRVRVRGPLAVYVPDFREELVSRGYRQGPVGAQLHLLAHLSRWLERRGLDVGQLTPERVVQYVENRRSEGRSNHLSQRALVPLLEHLRGLGAVPARTQLATTPVTEVLGRYRDHLVGERGLSETTVRRYESIARRFLSELPKEKGVALEGLTTAEVVRFLARARPERSATFARIEIPALRSLLRFCHVVGITAQPLAQAVPAGGGWASDFLPRGLDAQQVIRLLRSCDRRSDLGRRDYAILTLLVRLGLRASEVVALQLDDVDWLSGEILVRGKGRSRERLPLPTDVGEALVAYLRGGRPSSTSRALFLRAKAPHDSLGATGVTGVVYRASDRAGLPRVGAHRLRHTAATAMLHAGAPLSEIAQVLRHRSAATTAIYAKVNRQALLTLAQPWPGGAA
jgi:integrase/recombinase XerD